ncbi:MAG TPA: microcompartment protein [Porticoccus sp.]|nr:microcompartment protein [Porticoccus sp.]
MTELRVYLQIDDLQPQLAAYLGAPIRGRGYPPVAGNNSIIIEVAPALAIHQVVNLALKKSPDLEPGLLFVERQFGILELHSNNAEELHAAGQAILDGIGSKAVDQLKPKVLFSDIIEDISDSHAVILNRSRYASMILPGQSLLVYEMTPALFATIAANEAEREVPSITLIDAEIIGASGRIFMSGKTQDLKKAQKTIDRVLKSVKGRGSKK